MLDEQVGRRIINLSAELNDFWVEFERITGDKHLVSLGVISVCPGSIISNQCARGCDLCAQSLNPLAVEADSGTELPMDSRNGHQLTRALRASGTQCKY